MSTKSSTQSQKNPIKASSTAETYNDNVTSF